jgi:SpoVK/Ycf46/Vps4 family AAA+-type ATPase
MAYCSFSKMPFKTNKSFETLFGAEAKEADRRVRWFLDRPDFYAQRGLPYQLGVLLSGTPGSGKTAIIRAIAAATKRHLVAVNFSAIKTLTQLRSLFNDDELEITDSKTGTRTHIKIPIAHRIFVLDEIDALGTMVWQRTATSVASATDDAIPDELTLGSLLQILDGTQEAHGRIVVITSNRPHVLDEALIRPGRIDLRLHFGPASRLLMVDLARSFFRDSLDPALALDLSEVADNVLSPADVTNALFHLVYKETVTPGEIVAAIAGAIEASKAHTASRRDAVDREIKEASKELDFSKSAKPAFLEPADSIF